MARSVTTSGGTTSQVVSRAKKMLASSKKKSSGGGGSRNIPVSGSGSGLSASQLANERAAQNTRFGISSSESVNYVPTTRKSDGSYSRGKAITPADFEKTNVVDIPQFTPADVGDAGAAGAGLVSENTAFENGQLTPIDQKIEAAQGSAQDLFDKYMETVADAETPNLGDIRRELERETDIKDLKQQENNLSSQINTIVNKAQADQLGLEGQGRGITDTIIGGQQARINREAAIATLPIQAQLAAVQGNIALAKEHINTWGQIMMQDAQNQYNKEITMADAVYQFGSKQQQEVIDDLKAQKSQQLADANELTAFKTNALTQALGQGASSQVSDNIRKATNMEEVALALGIYGGDVLGRQLQMAQLDKIGYENNILAAKALEQDIPGGLTPADINDIDKSPQGKNLLAAADLKLKLNSYESLVDKHGIEVIGKDKAVLENAYNELLLSYKEAAKLGVLAGPDMDIINSAIREAAVGFGGALANTVTFGGQGRKLKANLKQAQITMNNSANLALDQLYARNPNYEGSTYVNAIMSPFGEELITQAELDEMDNIIFGLPATDLPQ